MTWNRGIPLDLLSAKCETIIFDHDISWVNILGYYRQDDVRLAIAHQIESRVAMSESYPEQTNKKNTKRR